MTLMKTGENKSNPRFASWMKTLPLITVVESHKGLKMGDRFRARSICNDGEETTFVSAAGFRIECPSRCISVRY